MTSSTRIKAVIFDMDGVLIDAREWHYQALNNALKLFGFEISRQEHLKHFDGLPTSEKLELLSLENSLPIALHELLKKLKQAETMKFVNLYCKPVFEHEYALANLTAQGYKIGVASNSVKASVVTMLTKANLLDYFDCVLSNEDVREPKPSPEIYLKAMDLLGCGPQECLIVEDNPNGLKAAFASGATVLQVNDPSEVTLHRIQNAITGKERIK